jgi:gamma-glutamyltranspeptidase
METILALRRRGDVVNTTDNGAVVQMIHVDPDTGLLHAVSDLRKGGKPAGY